MVRQFVDSGTKLVFTLTDLWPMVNKTAAQVSPVKKIPLITNDNKQNQTTPSGAIKFRDISEENHELLCQKSSCFEDVILLPYTSGTTELSKGVELTMKNIVSHLHQAASPEFEMQEDAEGDYQDVCPVIPHFGDGSRIITQAVFWLQINNGSKFGTNIFIDTLEKHRPTIAYVVPPIVRLLLNNPNVCPEHISQMRTIMSGGAPLSATDIERFQKKGNRKVTLLQGYRLTETSPSTHQQSKVLTNGIKLGGSGFAVPNTQCKIVSVDNDESSSQTELGCNQSGELLIRGPQVMKGYHNNPEATQEVLDTQGWFRTEDIGHYDEDGHFFITYRLKQLIKLKGFQVAPAELEQLLLSHPEIEDAAVVGVPHTEFGEVPKAFVVAKEGAALNPSKVQEYIAAKVAEYKQLSGGVVMTDSIPESPSGKILRRQLKNH